MDSRTWPLALALATLACAPTRDASNQKWITEGRTYTAWLYGNEYNKLWDRFSPEMRQTFGSVADLASFASRAVTRLGAEQGKVDEQVKEADPFRVYTRSASFDKSKDRMLIEWSLDQDGEVTGLVVRPAGAESGSRE